MAKKVLTYKPLDNEVGFLDYTERTVHTEHGDMYFIETASGHSIKATDDHSLAIPGDNDFFSPCPPQDSLGKFVPIPFNLDIVDDTLDLKYDAMNPITWPAIDLYAAYSDSKSIKTEGPRDKAYMMWLLFRAGLYYEVDGDTLNVDSESFGWIPEDGKLIKREEAAFGNPYRLMPFTWSEVVKVEKIEREETTYDFTVPEFPLFIGNSILVYDTMQVHVPVTEEARNDALNKMLPSKNLFSLRTLDPVMVPQQEHTFGVFLAAKPLPGRAIPITNIETLKNDVLNGVIKPNQPVEYQGHKTTAGVALINEEIPSKYRDYNSTWTKGTVTKILTAVGKELPDKYTKVADSIKELGSEFAYLLGASFKAKDFDLEGLKKVRDKEFDKVEAQLKVIDKSGLSKDEKYKKKVELLRHAQNFSQELTGKQEDNHFQQWAYSGSRGSKSQVMQIISSPVAVADPKDRVIPMLIRKSFNEGLSPADYWVSSYGTRKGTVSAKLSVAPGGAMAKEIIGNVLDVVISEKNCGTKRGIKMPVKDRKDVLERYEAGTNRLIDSRYYEELIREGKEYIEVRSPSTCTAKHGVCQMCYGYNEKGHLPEIGENIGVQAAQSITEPLTQMGLSSKHTAGTAAEEKVGLNTISKFFTMPNQYSGAAVIAQNTGRVTKIEPAPAGGTNIFVGTKRYHVVPGRQIFVEVGSEVKSGDIMSSGVPNLSKIVPHKGIEYSRDLFVNYAHDLYGKAGAPSIKKNFETVARGLINYVEVDDPGDTSLMHGDIVDYNQLMRELEELKQKHPQATPPKFHPVQRGTTWAPQDKPDFLANLGFKYLKKNLVENAAMGVGSSLHSYHPVAGYVAAREFGEGKDGRY